MTMYGYWKNGNDYVSVEILGEAGQRINKDGEIKKLYRVRKLTASPWSTFTVDRQEIIEINTDDVQTN